ncbi:MAG TPA: flagellar hook-length control protein FliK, partial [Planctomycetota bacterium]|nr:flagellar hook-length control protein FliK [Planctomycetota bacterium]
ATERGGELRLLLEPAQLGSLGVRLRIDGNAVRLELRADSAEVAALLERDASALEAELAAQGLSIDGFDIGSSSREEQHEAQRRFEDEVAKRDLDEIHSGLMALRQRVGTRAATVIRVAAPPTSIDTPTVANLDTVA